MTMRPPGRRRIVTAAAYRSRINDNSLWDLIINPPRYWFYRLGWPRPEIGGWVGGGWGVCGCGVCGGGGGCYNWDRETGVGWWVGVGVLAPPPSQALPPPGGVVYGGAPSCLSDHLAPARLTPSACYTRLASFPLLLASSSPSPLTP